MAKARKETTRTSKPAPNNDASVNTTPVTAPAVHAATLAGIDSEGRVLVAIGDAPARPALVAEHLSPHALAIAARQKSRAAVVLLDGDISQPLILALYRERIASDEDLPAGAAVKGQRVISAPTALSLVCGKSSIVLEKDGMIVMRCENFDATQASTVGFTKTSLKVG